MTGHRRRRPEACRHVGPVHALTYPQLYPSGWWCASHIPTPNPRRHRSGACTYPGPRHALTHSRLYPHGWWCAWHTPLTQRGIPEDAPGSGVPAIPQPSAPDKPSATQASATRRTELNL